MLPRGGKRVAAAVAVAGLGVMSLREILKPVKILGG